MTNKAEEKLTKAKIKLQSRNPFFSYLSLFVKFRKAKEGELPTDEKTGKVQAGMGINPNGLLIYNEEWVEKLNDEEVISVLCLIPETIIAGKEFKEIKDIKKDDLILNKNGELEKVKQVFKRKVNEKIYNIKAQNLLPIKATKEHPFLVRKYFKNKNLKKENRSLEKQFKDIKQEWVNAEDINKGDLIAIPKIKGNFNKKKIDLKEFHPKLIQKQTHIINDFQLNKETAWLLGLYIADGSKGDRSLRFNLNNYSKNKYFNKLKKILKNEFKITHTNIFQNKTDKGKNLDFCSTLLTNAFISFCGKNAKTKKIPHFILYNKDKKILQSFLDGYACGDGFYYKKAKQLQLSTISVVLAQQLQLAYLRLGKLAHSYNYQRKGVYHKIRGKELKNLNNYQIVIKDNKKKNYFLEDKNYIWLKVKKINKKKYNGFVHNFETEKTHTYTANNMVLHNCHEILHLSLLHLLRRGSREKTAWNIAVDLATNVMLVKNRFELPKGCLVPVGYDGSKFTIKGKNKNVTIEKIDEKTAEQIYEEIPELKEGDNYVGGDGEKSFDKHNEDSDGKTKTKEEQNDLENEWRNRLEEAYISAKQRGNVPNGLERYIDELKKSQVNWKALLRRYLQATIPNDWTWCVDENTKVRTLNGDKTKIKDLRKGRKIIGYENGKLVLTKIIDKFSSKVKEEFIITTKSGKKIKCSGEHNILTTFGYKKAKDLNIKDTILSIENE